MVSSSLAAAKVSTNSLYSCFRPESVRHSRTAKAVHEEPSQLRQPQEEDQEEVDEVTQSSEVEQAHV
jgi:hypothetical protein